jgi:hypothetical protein
MRVVWLKKQWGPGYYEYEALRPYLDAVWRIKAGANNLLYYSRGNQKTIDALNEIDRLCGELSRAIEEGDYKWAKQLLLDILDLRLRLEPPKDKSLQEGYIEGVLYLSDAIYDLHRLLEKKLSLSQQTPSQP